MNLIPPIIPGDFGHGCDIRAGVECCQNLPSALVNLPCLLGHVGTLSPEILCVLREVILRIEVVLEDPSRESPNYLDKWHVFLPSDLFLDRKKLRQATCVNEVRSDYLYKLCWVHLRFASIYKYDWELFKMRFLGPDGVAWMHAY